MKSKNKRVEIDLTGINICDPVKQPDYNEHECCQGCSKMYEPDNVMIVDGVGPVCFNCLYACALRTLG